MLDLGGKNVNRGQYNYHLILKFVLLIICQWSDLL